MTSCRRRSAISALPFRHRRAWKGLCPFHTEKTSSFTVFPDGHYHCFGCNAHGTVFDFIMTTEHIDFRAAINRVEAEKGIASSKRKRADGNGANHGEKWLPIIPPPADAPRPTDKDLRCDVLHEYCAVDDRLLCYIRRFEAKGTKRKLFLPLTFGIFNGKRGWHGKAPDTPKPLYGLNRLSHAASDAIVLLVEGEKSADAAQRLFPDHVGMSWMGGANADDAADLAPLAGRSVIIWGDADVPGQAVVARLLKRLPTALIVNTDGLPDGFDAADLERDGVGDPDSWLKARLGHPESDDAGQEPPPDREARTRGPAAPELDEWPEPVDFLTARDTRAPQLKERHVPPSLWPFITDVAERMGAAASSVALAAIVSCASVISEEWQIQPKRHDFTWHEGSRLWGAIVGSPSVLKSPIIAATTAPIVALEVAAHKEWADQMALHRAAVAEWKAGGKTEPEPEPPRKARYLVESATVEALQEVLRDDADGRLYAPLGKVLVRQDELSEFLAGMDKYSSAKGSDRGAYLRAYNGGRFSVDRIGRGAFVTNSWSACLLGGVQPDPIQRIATKAVDDGLLQRMMLDVPPPQCAGEDREPDRSARETYQGIFPALAALKPGRTNTGYPMAVVLHRDAHAAREDIDALARVMAAMPDASPRLQSTFGKWHGLFARLCLTFHLVEVAAARVRGEIGPTINVVPAEIAARVRRYMRGVLAPNLLRAEALIFDTKQTDHAAWIAGYILAHRLEAITARDVVRNYRSLRSPEERNTLDSTMECLCVFGWLAPVPQRAEVKPPVAWVVNPAVHIAFAERAEAERERRAAAREDIARHVASLGEDVDNVA
jgi:hypothetical protein